MAGKQGALSDLPTELPARYRARFAWALDRRSKVVREIAADLIELWQDLGGYDGLSMQQRVLCERVVFMRQRVLAFESAVMAEKKLPFDHGVYSNLANVLRGHLQTLGLERRQKPTKRLADFMSGSAA